MLRKLLKYEFRATARTMLPLYLLLLAAAMGVNLSTRGLGELGTVLSLVFALAVLAVLVMSVVLAIQRFRQSLLGDEGYLMFTLPVSVHEHLLAKMIVSSAWFIASAGAVVLALMVVLWGEDTVWEFFRLMGEAEIAASDRANLLALLAELAVLAFAAGCSFCLQVYASLAVGYSFSSHKTALSVGCFFLLGAVTSALTGLMEFDLDAYRVGFMILHQALWFIIIGTAAMGAVYYLITAWFLKHRLNLA